MVIPTTICWFSTKKPLQQSVRPSLFIFSPFPSLSSSEIKRKEAYVFVRQIARSCEERKCKVFLVVAGSKRNVDPSSWNEGSQTVFFAKRGIAFEEVRGSKLPEQEQDRQQPKGFFTTLQSRGRVAALLWRRNKKIVCEKQRRLNACIALSLLNYSAPICLLVAAETSIFCIVMEKRHTLNVEGTYSIPWASA